ncbi:carbohydrate ABC transporter permease [Paenibacillus mucilaginosus]|uniref:Binding-protein-dependent transport system inner membrane component n=1 Tax=Paenibacillus mucilaginosus (strain KNP414) TaxID=1036673 RepID=F8F9X7_PAEMK|nr:carbohydrate ABC transporter permease [Paenibacillus mucilaginosus]AEI45175.1 binding-protein-dependent transport system inner membrane component [Paenibacillus mucilaginosus KNP414]MCG7212931.1 carbohydrate ABC transporter permease [Paenibacillus mucilaginosus]WDM26655.1 carbohydrate ABC transporter permease [Paenibacillus mucilaginosus]
MASTWKRGLSHGILWVYLLLTLYPLVWVLNSSFKTNKEIITNPWGLPQEFTLDNYVAAWKGAKISTYFFNSFYVSIVASVVTILFASAAGYAITRMQLGRVNKYVNAALLLALLVPGGTLILPLFVWLRDLGLYNTHLALIFPYVTFGLPLTVFIVSAFMKSIPADLEEAGVMDGLTAFGLFARIILPLTVPALVTVFILNFLSNWNEFVMAYLFLSKEKLRTLPTGMVAFMNQFNMNYGGLAASIMFSVVPVLTVYAFLQEKIIEGVTAGSTKG